MLWLRRRRAEYVSLIFKRTVTASKEFITEFNGGVEVSHLYL
jgi:hypothetical protein